MTPERWERLKAIFHGAVDQPASRRAEWLRAACAGDEALRAEAEALLKAHDTAGDYLEQPASLEADEPDTPIPTGQRLGPDYEIHGVLGRGGMGIVYLAHDFRLGRRVALKSLPASAAANDELRERLRREARAAATITHRAVATVYALEEIDGNLFIASEYVPGRTLAEEIAAGPIAPRRALAIVIEVAGALRAAHDARIVHRDLKPDNVLITPTGVVKVVDFGIAHLEGPESTRLTRGGAMLGTPAYMAPEQLLGGAVDARSDLYAFGVVLSEMITGRHPLTERASASSTPSAAARADPLLARLIRIANRCMQADPADRYPSAQVLLSELEATEPAESAVPPPAAAVRSPRFWWEFHQAATALAYWLMVYPAWQARGVLGGSIGRGVFIATLAAVIVAANLRLHLWFTSRFYPGQLKWVRRRTSRWIRVADWTFAAVLIVAGLLIGDERSPLAVLLLSFGLGAAVVFTVIEPVTTRAAFKGSGSASVN